MNRDESYVAIVDILSQYDFGGVYDYKRRDAANDILDAIWPSWHETVCVCGHPALTHELGKGKCDYVAPNALRCLCTRWDARTSNPSEADSARPP